jgi:hypothetical protein
MLGGFETGLAAQSSLRRDEPGGGAANWCAPFEGRDEQSALAILPRDVQAPSFDAVDLDDDAVLHGDRHMSKSETAKGLQDMIERLAKVFVAGVGDGRRRIFLGATGHKTPGLAR